jgi:hypothetical protein
LLERLEPVAEVERRVAERFGAATIELFDGICPGDACRTIEGGVYMYRDAGHISLAAAEGLTQRFRDAYQQLLVSEAD